MKSIVVLSGGMDSAVALAQALSQRDEVIAFSVEYGQRHARELHSAAMLADYYGVEHIVADIRGAYACLAGSSQTSESVAVPHGHYAEESMKKTVVPNRNMILIALAGGLAISRCADRIVYGAHAGDHAIYPDCRPEFAEAMDTALALADWHKVTLHRPFVAMTKADICTLGNSYNVPFYLTYSCYEGRADHCGKCGTCVERREAFALAKIQDPTNYRD